MQDDKYTEDHEWARLEDDGSVTVGLTDYAQEQLGDIVYVELPELGKVLNSGDEAAVVESVKAAGEVYAPLSGKVIAVNEELNEEPELVNTSPDEDGWFLKMEPRDAGELDNLMDKAEYEKYIKGL